MPTLHSVMFPCDVLRLSLLLKTLTVLSSTSQVFCIISFHWNLSDFFSSWFDWGYGSLEDRAQRLSAILITSYQGYILSTWSIPVDDDLGHLVEVVLVRSSCGKNISLPPTISILCSCRGSNCTQFTLKEWKLYSSSFRA